MAVIRVRQESKRAVSSKIHSFLLHHMVGCCDFSGKVPAVGCVDDVLDGYFQSAHIVSGLHPTVIPIVDGDEANAQQREDTAADYLPLKEPLCCLRFAFSAAILLEQRPVLSRFQLLSV